MAAADQIIARAVERLRAGGLVAFPTETVYGLGADALSERAVSAVFALKGRPSHNPLIVHVDGPAMALRVCAAWPDDAEKLAAAFWPGPLSIVLPRAAAVPDLVTAGGPSVAVRCPDHPLTLGLLRAFGGPLVGPSANPSGRVSPTTAAHVRAAFTDEQVMVLDGGPCRAGIESTVVSLTGPRPRVLRPGVIGAAAIAAVLGREVEEAAASTASPATDVPLESPGLLDTHYAPFTPAVLVDRKAVAAAAAPGTIIIARATDAVPPGVTVISLPDDAPGYAAGLYRALREADAAAATRIIVVRPPRDEGTQEDRAIWAAVHDRLRRATRPA